MPNHLLTFLGISNYAECCYVAEPDFSYTSPFSSHAISDLIFRQYGSSPRITVSLTEGASAANKERFQKHCPTPSDHLNFVEIPEQADEASYWQIFQSINYAIGDDDTVWLDITHSFRYLPMLGYAVVQYLETVRKRPIGGIYYGAAEVLGPPKDWPKTVSERRMPLRDLTPFLEVNRWTAALREFNQSGSARSIRALTDEKALPLIKASRGKDLQAQALKKLGIALDTWTQQVQTCRGRDLLESPIGERVSEFIESIGGEMIPALSSEFAKLKGLFEGYEAGEVRNVFLAAEWCVEHGLTQQAWTLLQEGIVTYFTKHWGTELEELFPIPQQPKEEDARRNAFVKQRDFVTKIMHVSGRNIPQAKWKSPLTDSPDLTKHLLDQIPNGLPEIFVNLSASRNDINHAGFDKNASDHRKIAERAQAALQKMRECLPSAFGLAQ